MSDSQNIFGKGEGRLADEQLLAYLAGKLQPQEQREVEMWLAEEGMESDAIEGLSNVIPADIRATATRLNVRLHREAVKKRRHRRKLHTDIHTWTAIAIILVLVILAYMVIHRSL